MEDPSFDILTIDELSGYLKISRSSLYKLAQQGKIPCQKIGRQWRFHKKAIDKWLSMINIMQGNLIGETLADKKRPIL